MQFYICINNYTAVEFNLHYTENIIILEYLSEKIVEKTVKNGHKVIYIYYMKNFRLFYVLELGKRKKYAVRTKNHINIVTAFSLQGGFFFKVISKKNYMITLLDVGKRTILITLKKPSIIALEFRNYSQMFYRP